MPFRSKNVEVKENIRDLDIDGMVLTLKTIGLEAINYINLIKSPTRCNNFPVYYPDVYLQLNMFRSFPRPSSGAQ
jgi:hypothetical protein